MRTGSAAYTSGELQAYGEVQRLVLENAALARDKEMAMMHITCLQNTLREHKDIADDQMKTIDELIHEKVGLEVDKLNQMEQIEMLQSETQQLGS